VASVPGALIADLLIVAAMAYDWRSRGRPHPAYLIAGAVLLFVQVIRVPLGYSPQWIEFTHFLDGFG
jgi:predicted membrane protein